MSINAGMFSSNTDDWATPQDFFDKLDEEFHFDLDPCASDENHKCALYFTKQDDGLSKNWGGTRCIVIRRMASKSVSGLKRLTANHRRTTQQWSC